MGQDRDQKSRDCDSLRVLSWIGDGGFTKMVMPRDTSTMLTESSLTMLLLASPNLAHLEVTWPRGHEFFSLSLSGHIRDRVKDIISTKYLSFGDLVIFQGGISQKLLENAASCLKHLSIWGIPLPWFNRDSRWPRLPEVTTLRLDDTGGSPGPNTILSLFHLSVAFPGLE